MAFGPALVGALSLGSAGLQIMGGLTEAQGKAAGYRHDQDRAQRLAMAARTAAYETDANLREEMLRTLGQISAIRSAAGHDPSSPTGMAIEAEETRQSDRQRRIKVSNLESQATQYDRDASFFGYAASHALDVGRLKAFSTGLTSLAGLAKAA